MQLNKRILGLLFGVLLGLSGGLSIHGPKGKGSTDPMTSLKQILEASDITVLPLPSQFLSNYARLESNQAFSIEMSKLVNHVSPGSALPISRLMIEWLNFDKSRALAELQRLYPLLSQCPRFPMAEFVFECGKTHAGMIVNFWEEFALELGPDFAGGVAMILKNQGSDPLKASKAKISAILSPEEAATFFGKFELSALDPNDLLAESDYIAQLPVAAQGELYRALGQGNGLEILESGIVPGRFRKDIMQGVLEAKFSGAEANGTNEYFEHVWDLAGDTDDLEWFDASVNLLWEKQGFAGFVSQIDNINSKDLGNTILKAALWRCVNEGDSKSAASLWEIYVQRTGLLPMKSGELSDSATDISQVFPLLASVDTKRLTRYDALEYGAVGPRKLVEALANGKAQTPEELEIQLGLKMALHQGDVVELIDSLPDEVVIDETGAQLSRPIVIGDLARRDPDTALSLTRKLDDPSAKATAIGHLLEHTVGGDLHAVADEILTLPSGPGRDDVISRFAWFAGELNPSEGSRILREIHAGTPLPDTAISFFVRQSAEYDIAGILPWLHEIEDPILKRETLADLERRGLMMSSD